MDDKTKKALEKSIQHWEQNLEVAKRFNSGEGNLFRFLIGYRDCALCDIFFYHSCDGCPRTRENGQVRMQRDSLCESGRSVR